MKRPYEGCEQHCRAVAARVGLEGEYSPSEQYPAEDCAALFVHAHFGDLVVDVSEKLCVCARMCVCVLFVCSLPFLR